jgi:hypothetical protein
VPCAGVLKVETAKRLATASAVRRILKLGQRKFVVQPGRALVVKLRARPAARKLIRKRKSKGLRVKAFALTRDSLGKSHGRKAHDLVKRRPVSRRR